MVNSFRILAVPGAVLGVIGGHLDSRGEANHTGGSVCCYKPKADNGRNTQGKSERVYSQRDRVKLLAYLANVPEGLWYAASSSEAQLPYLADGYTFSASLTR